ncbi:CBS domain-containing protein [Nonomuraea recticatena]|uniref:CBS domain-containing protein n=1 Tax=Nonomuraea recticatena TaxID=46178 RepID=A0ABN3TFD9_9ACTN
MLAHELAHDFPALRADAQLADVLAAMVRGSLPGIVILGSNNRPQATLSLPEVLDLLLPWPFRESPNLANVFPDDMADRILLEAVEHPIGELLRPHFPDRCWVRGQATTLEVVTAMVRQRSPLAMVLDAAAGPGVISAHSLIGRLTQPHDPGCTGQNAECRW